MHPRDHHYQGHEDTVQAHGSILSVPLCEKPSRSLCETEVWTCIIVKTGSPGHTELQGRVTLPNAPVPLALRVEGPDELFPARPAPLTCALACMHRFKW